MILAMRGRMSGETQLRIRMNNQMLTEQNELSRTMYLTELYGKKKYKL